MKNKMNRKRNVNEDLAISIFAPKPKMIGTLTQLSNSSYLQFITAKVDSLSQVPIEYITGQVKGQPQETKLLAYFT